MARRLKAAGIAVALLCAVVVLNSSRKLGERRYFSAQRYEDVYYLPPPVWLKVLSLGHREALADVLWLKSLLYFSDELGHRGEVRHLYDYTDAMLALDPYFAKVYQWVASCALYRTGTVTIEDARKAIAYLERAVRLFPDDGELAWTLGATYTYELAPMLELESERDDARRQGLEHLKVAVMRDAGPRWLVLTTATEFGRLGQREQEIAHLEAVYDQISDPSVKVEIDARLRRLRGAAYAEALRHTFADLETARRRDFPYIDRELYLLVGRKPPFDGKALLLRGFDPEPDALASVDLDRSEPEP